MVGINESKFYLLPMNLGNNCNILILEEYTLNSPYSFALLTGILPSASTPCQTIFQCSHPLLRIQKHHPFGWLYWYARRDSNPGPTD